MRFAQNPAMRAFAVLFLTAALASAQEAPPAAPAPSPSETLLEIRIELNVETADGKALIVASGRTSLPDGTILRGSLAYCSAERPVELVAVRREEVRNGAYRVRLDTGFLGAHFPGTYQATVVPDALSSQPPAVLAQLPRKARLLRATATLDVGAPGAAREEERRLRAAWRDSLLGLRALLVELDETIARQARAYDAAAWIAWLSVWRPRLERAPSLPPGPNAPLVLARLSPDWSLLSGNPPWTVRDEAVRAILGIVYLAQTALPNAARDPEPVARARRHVAYHLQQLETLYRGMPLFRADAGEFREIVGRLRAQIDSLKTWIEAAARSKPGHAASDWPAWADAWRMECGREILRLCEGMASRPESSLALQAVAAAFQTLETSAERALSGGDATATVSAVAEAVRALEALSGTLPQE
jgi:hypothetical protein